LANVISCMLPGVEFDRAARGLLGAGERLAAQLETQHIILAAGASDTLAQQLVQHGDQVVVLTDQELDEYQPESCLALLHAACADIRADAVLLGQDAWSQELAPRLAHRLAGCSIADAQAVDVRDGRIYITRSVYGGKAVAVVRANVAPAVVWLRARAFEPESARSASAAAEHRSFGATSSSAAATKIIRRHSESESDVRLEDAAIIVSGGRGLGGPEPFDDLRQLASVMKAEIAASRAACDAGWVPPGLQVGQTGKKVAPELYVAIAISGASQHMMGITDAKVVAAINTDQDAPIFRHCQFGLVEDWKNVVGPLKKRIMDLL